MRSALTAVMALVMTSHRELIECFSFEKDTKPLKMKF